jgi:hypothetical protein
MVIIWLKHSKRKGKLFIEMQMLWITNVDSQNVDYGKPLYLRASYRSDLIFFGVAVVLCLIVAYCMSRWYVNIKI